VRARRRCSAATPTRAASWTCRARARSTSAPPASATRWGPGEPLTGWLEGMCACARALLCNPVRRRFTRLADPARQALPGAIGEIPRPWSRRGGLGSPMWKSSRLPRRSGRSCLQPWQLCQQGSPPCCAGPVPPARWASAEPARRPARSARSTSATSAPSACPSSARRGGLRAPPRAPLCAPPPRAVLRAPLSPAAPRCTLACRSALHSRLPLCAALSPAALRSSPVAAAAPPLRSAALGPGYLCTLEPLLCHARLPAARWGRQRDCLVPAI